VETYPDTWYVRGRAWIVSTLRYIRVLVELLRRLVLIRRTSCHEYAFAYLRVVWCDEGVWAGVYRKGFELKLGILPLEEHSFESLLPGLVRTSKGNEEWHDPQFSSRGTWTTPIILSKEEADELTVVVNGLKGVLHPGCDHEGWPTLKAQSWSGNPLHWLVHKKW
jgi:hypothetical protein